MTERLFLKGEVQVWDFGGVKREYIVVTLPFSVAADIFKPEIYNAKTGFGEQREQIDGHVKKLKTAMETGKYTPTPVSVGTKEKHRKSIRYTTLENGTRIAELDFDPGVLPTMPLINAHQRFGALKRLLKSAENPEVAARIEKLPITAQIYLDGSTREDFIALNQGKTIDAAHLLSLKVQTKTVAEKDLPYYRLAIDIAKKLATDSDSPFFNQIRFDSRGMAPLTINTLCAKGAGDIGTSLMGLAKVALHSNGGPYDTEDMAELFKLAFQTLKDKESGLLMPNKVLSPPPEGTKGSATMLVGLATLYIYRASLNESSEDVMQEEFVQAARDFLDDMISGNFSGPVKRKYLGAFAQGFFRNVECEKHHGIPKELVKMLSASTFGVERLPKEKKEPKERKQRQGRPRKKDKAAAATQPEPETQVIQPGDVVAVLPDGTKAIALAAHQPDENVRVDTTIAASSLAERCEAATKKHEEQKQLADRLTSETSIVEETPAGGNTLGTMEESKNAPWEQEILV